jgi:putative endonuclease
LLDVPEMAASHNSSLGASGEDLACRELARRGYAILDRRYRTRAGEIDIVARDGGTLVFVEVKARTGHRFGGPTEAVTGLKQQRIRRMAADYLARKRLGHLACRFDVVSVDLSTGAPRVDVIVAAF